MSLCRIVQVGGTAEQKKTGTIASKNHPQELQHWLLAHQRLQPILNQISYLPTDSATVRKVDLFGNLRISVYFQLPEAFRRLLRPSSSLGAESQKRREKILAAVAEQRNREAKQREGLLREGGNTRERRTQNAAKAEAVAMNGEEVAGPAGPKLVRLLYFVGAGFICTVGINKWRDFQRKSLLSQHNQNLQQQQKQP
ncbi:hypothetical protein TIFTF001_023496 [Ficus carica]|uniref:Uncharacterized protein n=1 Tax=Ficus carica TaxID=3494 RepID=A0AA88AJP7_FICCA|nr:hypothetical protein TIFTF001_023496 [Ficus carica]